MRESPPESPEDGNACRHGSSCALSREKREEVRRMHAAAAKVATLASIRLEAKRALYAWSECQPVMLRHGDARPRYTPRREFVVFNPSATHLPRSAKLIFINVALFIRLPRHRRPIITPPAPTPSASE